MINKHVTQAIFQQRKGINYERAKLFDLAISFYQTARNRWRQTPNSNDQITWCNGRISQCQAMMIDDVDDDN